MIDDNQRWWRWWSVWKKVKTKSLEKVNFSKVFFVSPVSGHFLHSKDFVVSADDSEDDGVDGDDADGVDGDGVADDGVGLWDGNPLSILHSKELIAFPFSSIYYWQ